MTLFTREEVEEDHGDSYFHRVSYPDATLDDIKAYLADKGLVAVPVEKLKEAEFMLGWNGGYDKTSDILQELLEAAGEGDL